MTHDVDGVPWRGLFVASRMDEAGIERPVYRNACVDAAGVGLRDRAGYP